MRKFIVFIAIFSVIFALFTAFDRVALNTTSKFENVHSVDFTVLEKQHSEIQECPTYELSYFGLDYNTDIESLKVKEDDNDIESLKVKEDNNELSTEQLEYAHKYLDIIDYDEGVTDTCLYLISKRLDLVPSNILSSFKKDNWKIHIVNYKLEDKDWGIPNIMNISALTDIKSKTIWVEDDYSALANSTCHELGHYLDYKYDMISCSEEFKQIYDVDKAIFRDSLREEKGYEVSSKEEYFACLFSEYCINFECKNQVPNSYNFMKSLIENFSD